ncbi:MAG: undecaprenyldiphospho-muramoylpentapeptide beta-N-acetylglucosaminyltransferase [Negativicutes bacterium]|nr:undecaprenyldiphospho-muramoylpentapeptide beta-N-acetylglucosaminyltransferase [Negativicutes bacterium]
MRIILSGGGTGGHIYPAVTIAKSLSAIARPEAILFVGTKQGLEADIVPKEGFPIQMIDVAGFERRLSLNTIINVLRTAGSLWQAHSIISEFKPDLVIGTGGYVCGPVLLVASMMGIPTVIQEQNVIPGVTNKILSYFVKLVAVGYKEAAAYFPAKANVIVTGNPIRPDVLSVSREEGLAALNLKPGCLTVLVAGGSRGARSINTAMMDVHRHFAGNPAIQILHVTGQNEYNNIVDEYGRHGIDISNTGNIIIRPYLYNMPQALAASDLAIFRAGAIGLAELTARGIPSILIPYPYAAENHQEFNARVLEREGAAVMIKDAELTGQRLIGYITEFLESPEKLQAMATASRRMGHPDAANVISRAALSLLRK